MKITFLSPPLNMSGGIKVIAIYADYLAKKGHDVLVVSLPCELPNYRERVKSFFKGSFFYSRIQKSHFDNTAIKQHMIDFHRPILSEDLPDADVIIATWWETAEWLAKINACKGKKNYLVQGHEVFDYIPKNRAIKTYQSKMHKIVVSKWLKDILQQEYGINEVDVVSNGVEKNYFYFVERNKCDNPTLGFLVSDSSTKGIDIAIKVVEEVKKTYPKLKVLTFGISKLDMPALRGLGIDFQLLPSQLKIREIYTNCDVWLASSRSEGFNLTAIEAMSCGTPIVSTKTGWPAEAVISYDNGILADIDDCEALTEGVNWFLGQTNESWKVLSRNAAETTDGYTWDKSCYQFEQILLNQVNKI